MCFNSGDCFVVLAPLTEQNAIIYGRNSYRPVLEEGEVSEVVYSADKDKNVILSKPLGLDGSESGANESGVVIGITWTEDESIVEKFNSTDLTRLALESSSTAVEAIDLITNYVDANSSLAEADQLSPKYCFLICDRQEAWLLNIVGKVWAAQKIEEGFRHVPQGLTVTAKFEKSSNDLQQKAQDLALWDGSGDFDFSAIFGKDLKHVKQTEWSGTEPQANEAFTVIDMFEILRTITSEQLPQSSHVSYISSSGISCHWFTATPNPIESVFKPFVFTQNARISPLTGASTDDRTTLLHKLHGQRNWPLVGELLRSLEATCVDEVKRVLAESVAPNSEFDELLKDCVEAEVKFYR